MNSKTKANKKKTNKQTSGLMEISMRESDYCMFFM